MKTVIMFSGQGAQYSGMGKDFYEQYPESKRIFDIAGDDITRLCFEGSEKELADTVNTQVCMYTVTMAKFYALKEKLGEPYAYAGFSLGEYAALTAGGAFSFEQGLEIVKKRASLMAAHGNGKGTIAACLGDNDKIEEVINAMAKEGSIITAANYNSPGQIVASGSFEAISELEKRLAENSLKYIPLKVSGPFHSKILEPVVEPLREALTKADIKMPHTPVYSNVTAKPYSGVDEILEVLPNQAQSSVKWLQTVENLADADRFIEIGCGKTLAGLVKRISKGWSEKKEIIAI